MFWRAGFTPPPELNAAKRLDEKAEKSGAERKKKRLRKR